MWDLCGHAKVQAAHVRPTLAEFGLDSDPVRDKCGLDKMLATHKTPKLDLLGGKGHWPIRANPQWPVMGFESVYRLPTENPCWSYM